MISDPTEGGRPPANQGVSDELRKLRNDIAHGRPTDDTKIANRLAKLGLSQPAAERHHFITEMFRVFDLPGSYFVPDVVFDTVRLILKGRSTKIACDPWAGLGMLASVVREATHARKTFAFAKLNKQYAALARTVVRGVRWQIGNPLTLINEVLTGPVDVVASVLPFRMPGTQEVELHGTSGETIRCRLDFSSNLLAAAALRLSADGIGLFVVTPSFFFSRYSVLSYLSLLGLGVEAAMALPAGSFAPFTNTPAYLVSVRRRVVRKMFVAQLSQDDHTNLQIIENLRNESTEGALDLGRYIPPAAFRGLGPLRLDEQMRQAEGRFGAPAVRLGELAKEIHFGRPGNKFELPRAHNALYIPVIGITDVVDSLEEMRLKSQNYAQVIVDPTHSDARFVTRFLNSEIGRSIREAYKSGVTIRKLNSEGLKGLLIFVPALAIQQKILERASRLRAHQNTLLGLQNDLAVVERELWSGSGDLSEVDIRLQAFSSGIVSGANTHVAATLDKWFETLPFPLASILRAWQATPSQDYKTKYEHLLHFFEATAEFLSVIYLSAFESQQTLFAGHKDKLLESWKKQNLSIERPTFGTWKVVIEYFSKQIRLLLAGESDNRALCAQLFADPSNALPEMLASKELAAVLSSTNKMRNDWTGHGGVVSQPESQLRNEQLVAELQKLRDAMAGIWEHVQLVSALHCQPRRGMFENEISILVGSNSEFLKESRSMTTWLDVERLYLVFRYSARALPLLPLVQVGPSPRSAKNACYFFNRIEKDGVRFVSYHFVDQPELKDHFVETSAAIRFLSEVASNDDH